MSSRAEQKAAARQARLQAEAHDAQVAARARRIRVLGALALVAVVAVVIAVVAAGGGSGSPAGSKSAKRSSSSVVSMLSGIPQNGLVLGAPKAKNTVEEFIDPQCPFCAEFSKTGLPVLINDYVRTGKVKLVLRPLAFIGSDSVRGARAVVAASHQNKAWTFLDILYREQGEENTGYMTDAYLRGIGKQVPGLDTTQMLKAATSDPSVVQTLQKASSRAQAVGANATPTLVLTKPGGSPQTLNVSASDYVGTLRQSLGSALGQ
jgi:protein-disulfide isomerase